jgi:hypothetical protein
MRNVLGTALLLLLQHVRDGTDNAVLAATFEVIVCARCCFIKELYQRHEG